ncbi:hypothetical protein ALP73_05285 [Pseudomonas coronafaciens pv. garcae]|nr:Uncharacterized protein AC511_2147 [Pseudomonas coronafaciens pv. oryzae]KPX30408.1 Uncharacterized protein ALO77_05247 [Pseudomonas coronafaciens pv. garcae]KPY02375.1 Uncharacterized protein ALO57_05156 [Pseudomonas coronafaciens pv. oryzae]RMS01611.1 hypothetical protein ALP73_05285 [Pseudomonas coronafaciens pv. garcae]RMT09563.1 hypothetical protein ALP55_05043 [Pseudomonas coronafaciens pv. oryzae]
MIDVCILPPKYIKIRREALEKAPKRRRLPIHYYELSTDHALGLSLIRRGVANIHQLKMEAVKNLPDVRVIVDAHHHLSFTSPHEVGHSLVVFEREIHAIASGFPIRGIHVVKGVGTVVTLGAVQPRKVFDIRARKPLPSSGKVFLDPQQIYGRTSCRGPECLASNFACEGVMLEIEKSGGSLNIGESFRAGRFLPFEHLPGAKRPFELAYKFFEMVLHHPVQANQLAVDVVQSFNRGGLRSHEVQRGSTSENFDIAFMWREKGDKPVGEAALAAHTGNNWNSNSRISGRKPRPRSPISQTPACCWATPNRR